MTSNTQQATVKALLGRKLGMTQVWDESGRIVIQSDTRIGLIDVESGKVWMSKPRAGGANFMHLPYGNTPYTDKLSQEDLFTLKAHIMSTAHGAAGKAENGIVQTDNSGALEVFA